VLQHVKVAVPTLKTHCNTLQHTSMQCNTLQHTASHCTATHCNTLQHTAILCNTLQHTTTPYYTLQRDIYHSERQPHLHHYTARALHCIARVLQSIAECCSMLQCIAVGIYLKDRQPHLHPKHWQDCSDSGVCKNVAVHCTVLQRVAL